MLGMLPVVLLLATQGITPVPARTSSSVAHGQDAFNAHRTSLPCDQDPHLSQAGLNECFANEAHAAEMTLQRTYNHYLKLLKDADKKNLIEAQKAWVRYRDAECSAYGGQFEGGSMQPMQYDSCRLSTASQRNKELRNDYFQMYDQQR